MQGKFSDKLTSKQIGEKVNRPSYEINEILVDINFIKKSKSGYEATDIGIQNGASNHHYDGNNFVRWDKGILENPILLNALNPKEKNQDEIDFRDTYKATIRTLSGHYVRSRGEALIANYLYNAFITFSYERKMPILQDVYCDFYIPKYKIYIEFWGFDNDEKYLRRKQAKQEIYRNNKFNLIEIDNKAIDNLDDFLPQRLREFGVIVG